MICSQPASEARRDTPGRGDQGVCMDAEVLVSVQGVQMLAMPLKQLDLHPGKPAVCNLEHSQLHHAAPPHRPPPHPQPPRPVTAQQPCAEPANAVTLQ